jgi:hypothetical protein
LGCIRGDIAGVRRIVWLGQGIVEVLLAIVYGRRGVRVDHGIRGGGRSGE